MGEWKRVKIGDVCTIEKGVTGLAKALPGDYPLVTTGAARKTSRDYQFDTKAVCIPLVSSTGHGKKTLNYVHYQEGKFALGSILSAVVPRDETILDVRYLHVYLQKNKDRVLVPLMKGAANVSLSMTAISNIEVPLPSLVEQKKILGKIDSISNEHEDFLNESDVQIDLLGKLRQAVLQEAIKGKLTVEWRTQNHELISGDNHASKLLEKIKAEKERLIKEGKIKKDKPLPPIADAEKPFGLPDGWVWCRLGSIVQSMNNGLYKPEAFYKESGVVCLRMYNIQDGKISFHNLKRMVLTDEEIKTYSLLEGDLLLNRVNSLELLGKAACIKKYDEPLVYESKNIRMRFFNKEIFPHYINIILLAGIIRNQILKNYKKVTGQASINQEQLSSFLIPLPLLAEQQAIVARVDKLMAMIDELEKQVSERKGQAEMLMQSVLREAFAG